MKNINYRDNKKVEREQEKISNLFGDLTELVDNHMLEFDDNELFFHSIAFLTTFLYTVSDHEKEASKMLVCAMEQGIDAYQRRGE